MLLNRVYSDRSDNLLHRGRKISGRGIVSRWFQGNRVRESSEYPANYESWLMRLLINHHYIMYRGWKLTSGYEYLLSRAYHTYVNLTSPYNYFYANEMMKEVFYIFILGGLYSEIYHTLMITRELDRREHVFGYSIFLFLISKNRKTWIFLVLFIK